MADTYTIQFRRGMYADFDTSKIRPGEPVAILGNDPSVPSGKALYIAFAANDVRRLCSIEDISEMVNAGEFVGPRGPKGEKGERGEKGADGTVAFESLTPEQKESLRGISIESASVDTDGNLTITFSNGDSEDVGNIMGPKGDNMSDEQAAQIEQNKKDVNSLKEDIDDLSQSYNKVNRKNTFHIFRIGGSGISNAVLKKDSENPYYCVLIDASIDKKFTISHTDTGIENGYRQFKAVAVDVTIKDMLAWGEDKGISTDHIEWLFAETGDYVQTKSVTVSDSMKTLVVQFSKDILPEYMEILVGTFETQKYSSYRNAIVPIGDVYSKSEAKEIFVSRAEAEDYIGMKQTYSLSYGRLEVCIGKAKFWIERRSDISINLDTWLIQRMYINDVVVMAGTDIEGPIKQVGASDFTGGIHGDEKFSTIKVLVDGNIIDLTATILEKAFEQLDIFVESEIYFCNTSNTAFTRCKHICFRRGKTIISNSIKYVGTDDYSVYRWPASGVFSIYKDLMTGYVTNTDCEYITNKGKENDVDFGEITFFGENYAVKIKNTGKKYSSYVGFVQDFSGESRPRFKVYFDTLNDYKGDVILKTNDKVFASYEIEVN